MYGILQLHITICCYLSHSSHSRALFSLDPLSFISFALVSRHNEIQNFFSPLAPPKKRDDDGVAIKILSFFLSMQQPAENVPWEEGGGEKKEKAPKSFLFQMEIRDCDGERGRKRMNFTISQCITFSTPILC